MHYFKYEKDTKTAKYKWYKMQFELADIVLSLTDNCIIYGNKIYAMFSRPEMLALIQHFSFDFKKLKKYLGINGDYVKREGDVFSENFNPIRNNNVLTLSKREMEKQARIIWANIFEDLLEIVDKLKKYSKNNVPRN